MYILTDKRLGQVSTVPQQQLTPEQKLVRKINSAIQLLKKATHLLQTQAQRELLIETIDALSNFFPKGYGVIDKQGKLIKGSNRYRIEVIDKKSMSIPKPFIFIYDTRLFLSHEKPDAGGRHKQIGNRGSQIRLYVRALARSSVKVNTVGGTVIHEMMHMWHDMHRSLQAKLGSAVAGGFPTSAAAALLDTRSFDPHRRTMEKHFSTLVYYLNQQPHRVGFPLGADIASNWADHLIEEGLAYTYTLRVKFAVAQVMAPKGRQVISFTGGFSPTGFLKPYLGKYWLNTSEDRAALKTPQAQKILSSMEGNLEKLSNAIDAHVGS
jgi:hypothetical protein